MRTLRLNPREDKRLRHGHLWIFSNEVDVRQTPLTDFSPGEQAVVVSAQGHSLGSCYVNPASLICGRLYSHEANIPLNATLLRSRLQVALELRERLFPVPYYRLCHGEGDWLPGLIIDRYGDVFAVQMTTAGMDACKDAIIKVLVELFRPRCIALRNDIPSRNMEQLPRIVEDALGQSPAELTVPENDVRFLIPFAQGQKTGWFYDQRRNHAEAARFARGGSVLDAFCYAGGFGVTAAHGGHDRCISWMLRARRWSIANAIWPPTRRTAPRRIPRAMHCASCSNCVTRGNYLTWCVSIRRLLSSAARTWRGPRRLPQDKRHRCGLGASWRRTGDVFVFTPAGNRVTGAMRQSGGGPAWSARPDTVAERSGSGSSHPHVHPRNGLLEMCGSACI